MSIGLSTDPSGAQDYSKIAFGFGISILGNFSLIMYGIAYIFISGSANTYNLSSKFLIKYTPNLVTF
jgi:hypothetical protein